MRLENKDIQGIFSYDPEITYTKGDFVVKDKKLYVVNATVMGIDPTSQEGRDYYQIYLKEETFDYSDTGGNLVKFIKEGGDKLVTAYGVGKILSQYMTGFDDKGIINNEILNTGETILRNYLGDSLNVKYLNPLDEVMRNSDLNNAVFRVDRDVAKSVLGDNIGDSIILRQYTYKSENESGTTRVQELVDPFTGMVRFRYAKGNLTDPSDWNGYNFGTDIANKINGIMAYYTDKAQSYEKNLYALRNCFRYRPLSFSYNEEISDTSRNTLELKISDFPGYSDVNEYMVTVCIVKVESNSETTGSIKRTNSLLFDLKEDSQKYGVGNTKVTIEKVDAFVRIITEDGYFVKDIYYKQTHGSYAQTTMDSNYKKIIELPVTMDTFDLYDDLATFKIDFEAAGVNGSDGFVIIEGESYDYGSTYKDIELVKKQHPICIEPVKLSANVSMRYESGERGWSLRPGMMRPPFPPEKHTARWLVTGSGTGLILRQSIYDEEGIQDVGKAPEFNYTTPGLYEKITKAYFIPK